jgi:hypothetical protein
VSDRVVFTDLTLRSVFTANSRFMKVKTAKFAARPPECAALCDREKKKSKQTNKQTNNR